MLGMRVWFEGTLIEVASEPIGFGRTCTDANSRVGWGYPGRFIEIGDSPQIHRLWGEITPWGSFWSVRSLGSLSPVTVVFPDGRRHTLEPYGEQRRASEEPDSLIISNRRFSIELEVGSFSTMIDCEISITPTVDHDVNSPSLGSTTINASMLLAEVITLNEYRVLWALTADLRNGRSDKPVSYTRIVRMLGLDSTRQAVAAVERMTRKFREYKVLGESTPPEEQRNVMCRRSIDLGLLRELEARYGPVG